jgi:hypothetical protein
LGPARPAQSQAAEPQDTLEMCKQMPTFRRRRLNPSAAAGLPTNYPAQDYGRLFDYTRAAGVGVVGIRVLAGGALSGSAERHPIAGPPPEPIGSAMSYGADVARARRLMPLVEEGFAASLTEAASGLRSRIRRWAPSWSVWQRRKPATSRRERGDRIPLGRESKGEAASAGGEV